MQPTRDGGPTKKPPRPLSRVTREETPASQTHKFEPRAHRGGSAGGTWGPGSCQAHQVRGSLASWTLAGVPSLSAFSGLGSVRVGHRPPRTA